MHSYISNQAKELSQLHFFVKMAMLGVLYFFQFEPDLWNFTILLYLVCHLAWRGWVSEWVSEWCDKSVEGGKGFFRDPWKALFISRELWNGKFFPRETWFGYRATNRKWPFFLSWALRNVCLFLSWKAPINHDSLFLAKNSIVSVFKKQDYVW